ncbi:hypothetical protein BS47DRAFT_1265741, partial [Hydnum rufescens UP504]
MIKVGKEFGVQFDTLSLPLPHKTALPVWLHLDPNPTLQRLQHSKEARCLRLNHQVITVNDLQVAAHRTTQHKNRRNCICDHCKEVRQKTNNACKNPHKCHRTALMMITSLRAKWNPMHPTTNARQELTPQQIEGNNTAYLNNLPIHFNASTLTAGPFHHNFRVFTDKQGISHNPA